jgi:hypothetical protein
MAIPNQGWLPVPLNREVTLFTLPEEYKVLYYVCNPGPYDPLQPYEKPIIEFIQINQQCYADSGWKNGAWGWVAGMHWLFAYGDALIDAIYPPLEPVPLDESCPDNDDVTTETCPPDTLLAVEAFTSPALIAESQSTVTLKEEATGRAAVNDDVRAVPVITPDANPV